MKTNYFFGKISSMATLLFCGISNGQDLVHYWDFNDNSSVTSLLTPSTSLIPGGGLTHLSGGISLIDFAGGTGQNFDVENLNARNGAPAGTHLRFNNPIGGSLEFNLPTTGYEKIVVKFATRRSGSGAGEQLWSYSIDGINFTPFTTLTINNGNPVLQTLDFSAISTVNNNPNFKLKVEFVAAAGGTVGNNRWDNFTLEGISIGGVDQVPPTVNFLPENNSTGIATSVIPQIIFNEEVRLIDNSSITNSNAPSAIVFKKDNATGEDIPFSVEVVANTFVITPNQPLLAGTSYYLGLNPNMIEDTNDNVISTSPAITFTTAGASVSFANTFLKVNEDAGTVQFQLNIENPSDGSFDLVVKPAPFSTADSQDFTLETQTIQITPSTPLVYSIEIPIIDDSQSEQHAEYFVLSLENAQGVILPEETFATIYITDNDSSAPEPTLDIELNYVGSFDPSGANSASTEIVDYDPVTKRLFTTSGTSSKLDIIDFSDPTTPSVVQTIDMSSYGSLTSVAVKNGIVAVASPNSNPQENGSVVFFDTNGTFLKQVSVGALPDMVRFTPDGTKVLTANEGEPNADYSIDPEASISIIDISNGVNHLTQENVSTLFFTSFNSQEESLIASGVRKLKQSSTLSQDLEPEYIAIAADSQKAWVTLQENNAIAEINLANNTITQIWALGTKDMNLPGNGFDASDNNGEILIANWPVKSFYMPDAIATYNVNGTNYIVTANEGDEKEFNTLNERTTVGAATYQLDSTNFPQAKMLKASYNLGRFRVTNLNGDNNNDGTFEEINSVGSRSFSIFNADTKELVYDSGDDFERYTAAHWTSLFNADHGNNNAKNRSRSKGPEPEGVAIATFGDQTFAFISLERIGGVMVYNITNPEQPYFVDYKNTRNTSSYGGDLGAEGILYIPADNTTTEKPYIVVANEISGTLTIYEVDRKTLSTENHDNLTNKQTFSVFPNPVRKGEELYFNRPASYQLFDISGKEMQSGKETQSINTSFLNTGMYILQTTEGITKKIIVK